MGSLEKKTHTIHTSSHSRRRYRLPISHFPSSKLMEERKAVQLSSFNVDS